MVAVAITGYGCISALGHTATEFRESLFAGRTGIAALKLVRDDPRLQIRIAAQVKEFDPAAHLPADKLPFLDPFSQFALVAAAEAIRHSGIAPEELAGPRTAVILGTGIGGAWTQDESFYQFYGERSRRLDPMAIPRLMPNAATSQISMAYGITGPSFTVCSACASSTHAAGVGLDLIRSGKVDRVITGGSEACITPGGMRTWELMRVLSPEPCSPFSAGRMGMVLGEGGGIVVLESLEAAKRRNAKVLAHLSGFGMTADAGDLLRPDPKGAARAMQLAIDDAGVSASDIDYINAHGTGTVTNDIVETQVIKDVLGEHAGRVLVSSTKSMHGHALGGAGALELVATIQSIEQQTAPPTINWKARDPKCDLDYVPNEARKASIRTALSNSFAFGGLNAVLCVQAPA
ncbi:MAG: beta-ketoacyl-[acyl-carrier-protein] synthase family protein [Hyphomicrobiales bacterium]